MTEMRSETREASSHRYPTKTQKAILASDLGYDDGGRYALLAVSGFQIGGDYDTFGTVFAVIDCDTGDQIETSPAVSTKDVRDQRQHWIARVRHLNGKQDEYAA